MSAKIRPPYSWRHDATWANIIETSGHWFDVDSVRFFSSRISWRSLMPTRDGYAFISSEQHDAIGAPRLYTIREWKRENGDIDTLSKFQQYATREEARRALVVMLTTGTR